MGAKHCAASWHTNLMAAKFTLLLSKYAMMAMRNKIGSTTADTLHPTKARTAAAAV
jgi:hypothetical protein